MNQGLVSVCDCVAGGRCTYILGAEQPITLLQTDVSVEQWLGIPLQDHREIKLKIDIALAKTDQV